MADQFEEALKAQTEFANAVRRKLEVEELRDIEETERPLTIDEQDEVNRVSHTIELFDEILIRMAPDFLSMTEVELAAAINTAMSAATAAVRKASPLHKARIRILNRQSQ